MMICFFHRLVWSFPCQAVWVEKRWGRKQRQRWMAVWPLFDPTECAEAQQIGGRRLDIEGGAGCVCGSLPFDQNAATDQWWWSSSSAEHSRCESCIRHIPSRRSGCDPGLAGCGIGACLAWRRGAGRFSELLDLERGQHHLLANSLFPR